MHSLLYFLRTHEGVSKQRSSLLKSLQTRKEPASLALSILCVAADKEVDCNNKRKFSEETFKENFKRQSALLSCISSVAIQPSDLMEDVGYSCCQSPNALKDLLRQFPNLKENDVAKILSMMARTYDWEKAESSNKEKPGWNVNLLIDTIKELVCPSTYAPC